MTHASPRSLPSVSRLLTHERLSPLLAELAPEAASELVREALADIRAGVLAGAAVPPEDALLARIAGYVRQALAPSLRPVINATGVILHTNLGRAPLSRAALEAARAAAAGYSNLEFDLEAGERGSRFSHLDSLLRRVTGAEAGIAVNNNASALYLVLQELCGGREVVISRGQAVEIGGGFRIPDVMRQSGARLVEVGTTNKTYLRDYEAAVSAETAALLRVHASNFRIIGFTETVGIADLASLARQRGVLALDDLGSGALLDTTRFGLLREPTVQESIAAGVDLAMFSGDKLLGGPQAGIIVGRRDLVDRLRRHPLSRALRMDKITIAVLAATLVHYVRGEAEREVPVWRMIGLPKESVTRRARAVIRAVGPAAHLMEGRSMIGGGSLPEEGLPTSLIAMPASEGFDPGAAARALRRHTPPIVARIDHGALLLDLRTVGQEGDRTVAAALREIVATVQGE